MAPAASRRAVLEPSQPLCAAFLRYCWVALTSESPAQELDEFCSVVGVSLGDAAGVQSADAIRQLAAVSSLGSCPCLTFSLQGSIKADVSAGAWRAQRAAGAAARLLGEQQHFCFMFLFSHILLLSRCSTQPSLLLRSSGLHLALLVL